MAYTIHLRHDGLNERMIAAGMTDNRRRQHQLAEAIDMNRSTVNRTLRGEMKPGEKFIAGALAAFGAESFTDLFDVVVDESAA